MNKSQVVTNLVSSLRLVSGNNNADLEMIDFYHAQPAFDWEELRRKYLLLAHPYRGNPAVVPQDLHEHNKKFYNLVRSTRSRQGTSKPNDLDKVQSFILSAPNHFTSGYMYDVSQLRNQEAAVAVRNTAEGAKIHAGEFQSDVAYPVKTAMETLGLFTFNRTRPITVTHLNSMGFSVFRVETTLGYSRGVRHDFMWEPVHGDTMVTTTLFHPMKPESPEVHFFDLELEDLGEIVHDTNRGRTIVKEKKTALFEQRKTALDD